MSLLVWVLYMEARLCKETKLKAVLILHKYQLITIFIILLIQVRVQGV